MIKKKSSSVYKSRNVLMVFVQIFENNINLMNVFSVFKVVKKGKIFSIICWLCTQIRE